MSGDSLHTSVIHDTINLYLRLNGGIARVYTLALMKENIARHVDIPIIYDVTTDNVSRDGSKFFIVPRISPKTDKANKINMYKVSNSNFKVTISADHAASRDPTILFYEKRSNFELCSPGFSKLEDCKKWWRKHQPSAGEPESSTYKNHAILRLYLYQ